MSPLSARVGRTQLAATFAMAARARALRAEGHDVISLSLGEPDFPTPEHVIHAAYEAARRGETKYPPLAGTEALKAAIAKKYRRDQKLDVPVQNILVTNGGKQAIFNVIMALIDEGDEVVIPAPAWAGYEQTVQFAGGRTIFAPCRQEENFVLQPEVLEAAITPRTRLLLLNYPNNPSGAACDEAALAALAAVLRRHPDVWVLSDDIYEHLLFDGFRYATLASVAPDLAERCVTMTGVSKTYAMTGWRVGFCAAPAALIKALTVVQATATSGVSSVGQAAALAALEGPQDYLAERRAAYQARRDLVLALLREAPGLSCHRPDGAFYVFPDISGCLGKTTPGGTKILSDDDFVMALLNEAHVAVVQGSAFAMSPHVRLSTATSEAVLARACERIAAFCAGLR
ncbi:MAG TPA: pyridoxal phosphate-dependent aminotransferase [Acidocella sp.]|uniref:pyridoxal phosphate-dependent aminotransferase n=1 Tax=Acidocella sp. TaxID=50710 RepID=UPI002C51C01E|nr:pyridoxal phosphate-dependent aminotransferase [Acidocella sp.]HVE23254.1 pyridoxal phosphate-dependent aminotransferase [Acidocella sp.]